MLAKSENTLGLAGFLPFIEDNEMPALFSSMDREEEFINQFRRHIVLEGNSSRPCARVSFLPYNEREEVLSISSMTRARLSIERGIMNLESQISILQNEIGHFDQLVFIRARSNNDVIEEEYAELASIDVGIIKEFLQAYEKSKEILGRYDFDTLSVGGALLGVGSLFYGPILRYFPTLLSVSEITTVRTLDPLLKTLEPILDSIGITQFDPRQSSQAAAIEIFHLTALVVQSLCLMFQSYLRRSMTPFHSEFLTCPISGFVLEGTCHDDESRKIYASSQSLTCLGDMLKQDVLVFGLPPFFPKGRLDLVTTTAQLVSIWGPAELVIRNNDEFSFSVTHEASETTGSREIPSTHRAKSIVGIKIRGGKIVPTGKIIDGLQQWHWWSITSIGKNDPWSVPSTHEGIDLHTPIRIGGVESHLSFHPIGPATWNKECPSSSVLDLYPYFSSNMKVAGVRDPSISFKSLTFGLQGGQWANIIVQGTFEAEPGTPVKQKVIGSMGLFKVQLAEYDRMWGLFVSLCTGVMTRVRLREVLAFFCLHFAAMDIPRKCGQSYEEGVKAFTDALCGKDRIIDWFESLIPTTEKEDLAKRDALQKRIISLFQNTLVHLDTTGVSDNGDLVLAYLSEDKTLNTITLSGINHPWVKVLSDTSLTATFACVSLHCFPAGDCECRSNKWSVPNKFRLATKLGMHELSSFSPGGVQHGRLQVGRSYWINSSNLNLIATVNDCIKKCHSDLCYYISVKKSALPIDLVKRMRKKLILREDDSPNAVKCIVSGGSKYLHQLKELKQEGKMKTQSP